MLLGQDNIPIITKENASLMRGSYVYTVSCKSSKVLGKEIIKAGGSFWGFEETFLFNIADQESFKEFANAGIKAILDGKTSEEAWKISTETARKWFQHYTQREIEITNKNFNSIEKQYLLLPKTSPQFLSLIKEAYKLRMDVLKSEMKFSYKRGWKIEGEKTIEAFKKIEKAEELTRARARN